MQVPPNLVRRGAVLAGLLLLLGALAFTLTQCQMVGDRLTGVETPQASANSCIKACNDTSKVHFNNEQQLHNQNVQNCLALPQPQRDACLTAEDQRHDAEMARLSQEKIDCQNNCHEQGAGRGQ